jgi:hypothetical protein
LIGIAHHYMGQFTLDYANQSLAWTKAANHLFTKGFKLNLL